MGIQITPGTPAVSAGSTTLGTATLNFGATPTSTGSIAVTGQTGIAAGSHVDAFFMRETVNEEAGSTFISLNCGTIVAGTGFTIYASILEGMADGTFTVHWRWS